MHWLPNVDDLDTTPLLTGTGKSIDSYEVLYKYFVEENATYDYEIFVAYIYFLLNKQIKCYLLTSYLAMKIDIVTTGVESNQLSDRSSRYWCTVITDYNRLRYGEQLTTGFDVSMTGQRKKKESPRQEENIISTDGKDI